MQRKCKEKYNVSKTYRQKNNQGYWAGSKINGPAHPKGAQGKDLEALLATPKLSTWRQEELTNSTLMLQPAGIFLHGWEPNNAVSNYK